MAQDLRVLTVASGRSAALREGIGRASAALAALPTSPNPTHLGVLRDQLRVALETLGAMLPEADG